MLLWTNQRHQPEDDDQDYLDTVGAGRLTSSI